MATTVSQSLQSIADDVLLARLSDLVLDSRRNEAAIVAHVAEVDARGLYAREACDSMFTYCTRRLHLSEAEAYLRITAARASRSHPVLLTMLADGRLHLSAVTRLAPVLTADNRDRVLARAVHASKREILELVAELSPRADVHARIRKLPERRGSPTGGCIASAPGGLDPCGGPDAQGADSFRAAGGQGAAVLASTDGTAETRHSLLTVTAASSCECAIPARSAGELCPDRVHSARVAGPAQVAPPSSGRIEPLAPARYKVQFTAGSALREKLERLQQLMHTTVPDGDLAELIEDAVTEKIARLEAERLAAVRRPRRSEREEPGRPGGRHIPAAVKRAVRARDGDQCRFVDAQGRRCAARERLEFHHLHPYGYGGECSVDNICLMCRTHNVYLAEIDYGRRGPAGTQRGVPDHGVAAEHRHDLGG